MLFLGSDWRASITAALNAVGQIGPLTFTVTGTCNENVSLNDARSLTFVSGTGGAEIVQPRDFNTFDIVRSQNIALQNLQIVGVPGSTLGGGGEGVDIGEASDVRIFQCDIHDNEAGGVFVSTNSLLFLRNTRIHNNTPNDGLDVFGTSTAFVRGSTIEDNGSPGMTGGGGVFVTRNSLAVFQQNNIIQNNADEGIGVANLSTVLFNGSTIVRGHHVRGISMQGGSRLQGNPLIQGNGTACPTNVICGGIFATGNSTLGLSGTISGNQGAGIFVQEGTNVRLNGVTVSNNSGDGVHMRWISIGDFGSGNAITGNGGASVFCDERSLAVGDLSGFPKVKCEQAVSDPPSTPPRADPDKNLNR